MPTLHIKGGIEMLKEKHEQLWKTQDELTEVTGLIIKLDQPKNEAEERGLAEAWEKEAVLMETEEWLWWELASIDEEGKSLKEEFPDGDAILEAAPEQVGKAGERMSIEGATEEPLQKKPYAKEALQETQVMETPPHTNFPWGHWCWPPQQ